MHLFPFEHIERGSNIVLYGAGKVGSDYATQIAMTGYCNILCALDQKNAEKKDFPVQVHPPEKIREIRDYAVVLVTLSSAKYAADAKACLMQLGVPEEKILVCTNRFLNDKESMWVIPDWQRPDDDDGGDTLRICVIAGGGIGDALCYSVFCKEIRKLFTLPVHMDFCCESSDLFADSPYFDHVYSLSSVPDAETYDVVMSIWRFVIFRKIKLGKVKRFSPVFHDYCLDVFRISKNIFNFTRDYFQLNHFTLLKGKNRVEQCNLNGIIPFDRNTPTYMSWNDDAFGALFTYRLEKTPYIAICNSIGPLFTSRHQRLWPIPYFNELLRLIKQRYPHIQTIRLGTKNDFGKIDNIDLDLIGKTSLEEAKVILKYSTLLISVEGGLMHLMHSLNGKAVCLFGPTLPDHVGYEENINLRSELCPAGCEFFTQNWLDGCTLGPEAKCMEGLLPDFVFSKVDEYLDEFRPPRYRLHSLIDIPEPPDLDRALDKEFAGRLSAIGDMALIYRAHDECILKHAASARKIMVYDHTLFIEDGINKSPNCLYAQKIKRDNVRAEYGFLYNIPAKDCSFDLVANFTLAAAKHPGLALREFLRIAKPGGCVVVFLKGMRANDGGRSDIPSLQIEGLTMDFSQSGYGTLVFLERITTGLADKL